MNYLMAFVCIALVAFLGSVLCVPAAVAPAKDSVALKAADEPSEHNDIIVKRDWNGMRAAWGKRADDYADLEEELPERQRRGPSSSWQSGMGAWGKRANDWGSMRAAWGKRTPTEWNPEYIQTLQRQMEAVKNRRAGTWQLASWGRRR
ncbi:hypothetical protein BV898_16190 [Hypsibius exemplaris]|uniref:Uncharacterized protein n=1 Tax=Hypsibius exemplaris TaxID=2072580 RepID=A0A9X6NEU3_HYPEX|nr:hypothetical protein BV898_16190 [Hypsibius exemplaris]